MVDELSVYDTNSNILVVWYDVVLLTVIVDKNDACHAKHGGQQGADSGQRGGPAPERPAMTALATDSSASATTTRRVVRLLLLVRIIAVVPSVDGFHNNGTAATDATATDATSVCLAPYARAVWFRKHHHLVIQIGVIAVRVNVTATAAVTVHAVRGHRQSHTWKKDCKNFMILSFRILKKKPN